MKYIVKKKLHDDSNMARYCTYLYLNAILRNLLSNIYIVNIEEEWIPVKCYFDSMKMQCSAVLLMCRMMNVP